VTASDAHSLGAAGEASDAVAAEVAAAVTAVPGVAGLHGGRYGDVATYLPLRRVTGVRLNAREDRVEVHVVAEYLPDLLELAERVRTAARDVVLRPIDVTIEDIRVPEQARVPQTPHREEHQW